MKFRYCSIIACMLCWRILSAQDPVVFSQLSNTQITQQDSIVMISSLGEPFGGIYMQNGLIINFEPFPFLILGGVSTSTRDLPAITDLKVFPNPVADIAVLQRDQSHDRYLVSMYLVNGSTVLETAWEAGAGQLQLVLDGFPGGMYVLIVTDEKQTKASHFKIMKQ